MGTSPQKTALSSMYGRVTSLEPLSTNPDRWLPGEPRPVQTSQETASGRIDSISTCSRLCRSQQFVREVRASSLTPKFAAEEIVTESSAAATFGHASLGHPTSDMSTVIHLS